MTTLVFAGSSVAGNGQSGGFLGFIPLIIILIGYLFYKRMKNKSKDLPVNFNMQKKGFNELHDLSEKKICILCKKQRDGETVRIAISQTAHLQSFNFHACNECVRWTDPKRKKIAVAIFIIGVILSGILYIFGYDPDLQAAPIGLAGIIALALVVKVDSLNDTRKNLVLDFLVKNVERVDLDLYVLTNKGLRDARFHRHMPYKREED
jgi:hypothetical protein